jgi:acyl-[acyl-carrier-protein]-phospholipid O-acyltransferase/long-chain-fatty-acid--[acyl-carrier-protein] ligase
VELVYLEDFRKQISQWERIRTFLGVLLVPGFLQEMMMKRRSDKPAVSPSDDIATIIFSSGSTGDPKGVMLTHANIAANVESMIQGIDIKPADRLLGILPFFHSFGYSVTLWAQLQVGASSVFYPNPLAAREIGEVCQKYQPTIFLSTPTFLRSYLRRCEPENFRSVRILMCGAEKLPQSLAQEFKAKFDVMPLEGYGCTELSPAVAANVPDWQQDNMRQVGTKFGTIGQPLPGIAVRVVHKETLQDLPVGQEGLLLVYGANVMKGYLGRDDLTQKKIVQGGWYITGDLAMLDEDGFITITGREERFAKVGGEMVPLEKVEEEIHAVLKSNDRMVAVTAIPDAKRGERIIVLYLPSETLNIPQVCKELGERGLPNIYIPGPRDWVKVDALPILGSGKLDLKKCKQMALDLAKGSGDAA